MRSSHPQASGHTLREPPHTVSDPIPSSAATARASEVLPAPGAPPINNTLDSIREQGAPTRRSASNAKVNLSPFLDLANFLAQIT